jgi:hypothetical protein
LVEPLIGTRSRLEFQCKTDRGKDRGVPVSPRLASGGLERRTREEIAVEQVKLLQSLGCEQSQGYLHSRPVPAEQFGALLICATADRYPW